MASETGEEAEQQELEAQMQAATEVVEGLSTACCARVRSTRSSSCWQWHG